MIVMFLFYSDEAAIAGMSREDRNGLVERHVHYNHEVLEKRATVLATRGLDPTHEAYTVRPKDGRMTVTPGPFARTAEALAGFYLVECEDLAEAVELAKAYPMPEGLGCIEIRPVMRSWDYAPSVDTAASPAEVWQRYVDVGTWPEWKFGVDSVRLDGPFAAGTTGELTPAGRPAMPFRLTKVEPERGYTSETEVVPGGVLRMEHALEELPGGGTRITHRATVPRAALDAFGLDFSPKLYAGIKRTLDALSAAARRVPAEVRDYPFARPALFQLPTEFAWLRRHQPVTRARVATGDEVWLVTRYDDVRTVLADRRLSRNIFRPDAARLIPGVPTRQVSSPFVDPPAHTRWRRLVSRAFTPRHVAGMRERVQEITDRLLDQAAAGPRPVDLVPALAYPLSISVICELFGIAEADHEPFRKLADTGLTITGATEAEKGEAFAAMAAFARDLIAAKRDQPGTDLLSGLVAVHDEDDGRLSEEELVATILAMLVGGYESTTNQIGKALLVLFANPDQLARLRAEPELLDTALDEILRYASMDSGFGSPRYATEDVPVGGVVIPKGSTVLVIRQSADRDEDRFPDPDRFDITREGTQHTAFGHGPHRCLGAALARLELEVAIATVLRRFPGIRLTMPAEKIEWDYRITAAGPAALPVEW